MIGIRLPLLRICRVASNPSIHRHLNIHQHGIGTGLLAQPYSLLAVGSMEYVIFLPEHQRHQQVVAFGILGNPTATDVCRRGRRQERNRSFGRLFRGALACTDRNRKPEARTLAELRFYADMTAICSTIDLLIDNPSPVPCTKLLSLTNRSKIFLWCSWSIPVPVSSTQNRTSSPSTA